MGEARRASGATATATATSVRVPASARLRDKALLVLASVTVLAVTFGVAPFQSRPAGAPALLSAALVQ